MRGNLINEQVELIFLFSIFCGSLEANWGCISDHVTICEFIIQAIYDKIIRHLDALVEKAQIAASSEGLIKWGCLISRFYGLLTPL
ncbi:hypothetical protein CX649_07485 [Bacillaceae bacterium ZC4]|nr:hypothetical protein CX649_07485 [Bacillaceae bacterium ZC4]